MDDLQAFDDFALAMSKVGIAAREAADAMAKLASAAVDWPMTIAAIAVLLKDGPESVYPDFGVTLTASE